MDTDLNEKFYITPGNECALVLLLLLLSSSPSFPNGRDEQHKKLTKGLLGCWGVGGQALATLAIATLARRAAPRPIDSIQAIESETLAHHDFLLVSLSPLSRVRKKQIR
jgi:hypothetical protein